LLNLANPSHRVPERASRVKSRLYLAFIKIGLDLLTAGGYLLYIIPHSFLLARNAEKLRLLISGQMLDRLIADLSEVSVSKKQIRTDPSDRTKKAAIPLDEPCGNDCTMYRVRRICPARGTGGRTSSGPYFDIYSVKQSASRRLIGEALIRRNIACKKKSRGSLN